MKANRIAAAVAAMMLISAPAAMAASFGLPAASAAPAASTGGDAVAMQEGLVKQYAESAGYINAAQAELAAAFGFKDRAAELQAAATALQGGATLDKDAIKKNRELTDKASAEIDAKIAEGADLNDEGRKHYIASLTPFTKGVSSAAKLPAEANTFSDAAQAQIKSASLTEKMSVTSKLSAGTYLAKEIPGFSKNTLDSLKKIVTYAQDKGIPVPKEATTLL